MITHWARRRRVIWFWKWQPLAATRVAASGRKWPPAICCLRQPFAASSHLQPLEWPQVAASGRHQSLVSGSHFQPLAATRVAASGRKWPPDILPRKLFDIFRGHLQPLEWPQVAASGRLTSSHGTFSTFSAANPHSERQGKTHNENARV